MEGVVWEDGVGMERECICRMGRESVHVGGVESAWGGRGEEGRECGGWGRELRGKWASARAGAREGGKGEELAMRDLACEV